MGNRWSLVPEAGKRDDGFIKSPRGNKIFPDWIGGVIPPGRLDSTQNSFRILMKHTEPDRTRSASHLTWMSPAAGWRRFSKCFCLCCSWTFRAKPEPRIPCSQNQSNSSGCCFIKTLIKTIKRLISSARFIFCYTFVPFI